MLDRPFHPGISVNPLHGSYRLSHFLGFLACAGLLGYAIFVQFAQHIQPCPLCILQRLGFIFMGVIFLIAAILKPVATGRWIIVALIGLGGLFGLAVAARQLWLQAQPPSPFGSCGAPLNYMLQTLPIGEVVRKVFTGLGDCGEVRWRFLGMAMPFWSMAWFGLLTVWSWLGLRRHKVFL